MLFTHDDTHKTLRRKISRRGALGLLPLVSLALLAGCGGGGGGGGNGNPGPGTTTTTGAGTGTQTPLTVSVATSTGLTASITEASSTVSVGGTLVYTLTLTNNTPNAILAPYAGSTPAPSVGVKVIGPNGVVSFQPLPGGPPLSSISLAPGQAISTTQEASGFTTAGTYTATATFSDGTSAPPVAGPLTVTAR